MKTSLLITFLILVVAGALGRRNQASLAVARETHARVVEDARAMGLSPGEIKGKRAIPKDTKTRRENPGDREAEAKAFATKLAAFAREMKEMESRGEQPGEEVQKRIFAILEEMMELDVFQLKVLVAELKIAPGLDNHMRRGILGLAIMSLANDHPREALELFAESSDLLGERGHGEHVISSALSRWAHDDPVAALEWIHSNGAEHPELVNDNAKRAVVAGAAHRDPRLAFQLIGELRLEEPSTAAESIAGAARTPAERSAVLAALRDHLKGGSDPGARKEMLNAAVGKFGSMAMEEGFNSASVWLKETTFSDEENAAFVRGFPSWRAKNDTGQWIDWMAEKVPEDLFRQKTGELVKTWTRQDYKAAGEWINSTGDGPARQAAVGAYAVTVAPYEPASAAQWAETLPAGKDRDEALEAIHSEWQKKDTAAAQEFARKHGIAP